MANRSREKVALIIFVLLLALGAFLIGSYIVGGHSLNVAATQINDTFGNMEGYSAIVFEGTQKPEEESSSLREDASVSDEKHQHDSFDASALPEDKGQTALGESFDLGDAQDPPNASGSASSSADDRERAALEIAARSSGLGKESAVALLPAPLRAALMIESARRSRLLPDRVVWAKSLQLRSTRSCVRTKTKARACSLSMSLISGVMQITSFSKEGRLA